MNSGKCAIPALVAASIATGLAAGPAFAANPDAVLGTWNTPTRHGVVEITRCGASICGRILSSDNIRRDPELRDTNNKDQSKRSRKLKDLQILGGFTREKDKWSGGSIYNAEDGNTYHATITPAGADMLKLKGCVVWPLCKTQTWTRVK